MPKPADHRNHAAVSTSVLSALFLGAGAALLSACSSPQHASTVPGTTPSIWTGSPAPSGLSGHDEESPGAQSLTSTLTAPDGTKVATAKFEFANG